MRWDKVAEGLGCHAEYAERIDDLEAALRRAAGEAPGARLHENSRDANLAIPRDLLLRFVEVYQGPMG